VVGDDIELPAQRAVPQGYDADSTLGRCRGGGDTGEDNTEIEGSEGQENLIPHRVQRSRGVG